MPEVDVKTVTKELESIRFAMAALRSSEAWWRLLSTEHRRLFAEFAELVRACDRSLPGPPFQPKP